MLWLPKWLNDATPPPSEGVSRRTFLFMGGAAIVAAALPLPDLSKVYPLHIKRNLSARVLYQGGLRGGKTQMAFVSAMQQEMAGVIADLRARERVALTSDMDNFYRASEAQLRFMREYDIAPTSVTISAGGRQE